MKKVEKSIRNLWPLLWRQDHFSVSLPIDLFSGSYLLKVWISRVRDDGWIDEKGRSLRHWSDLASSTGV